MQNKYKYLLFLCLALLGFGSAGWLYVEKEIPTTSDTIKIKISPTDTLQEVELVEDNSILPSPNENLDLEKFTNVHFLVFKNERKLEIWLDSVNENPSLYRVCNVNFSEDVPNGVFGFSNSTDGFAIDFPNEFYKRKLRADRISSSSYLKKIGCSTLGFSLHPTDIEFVKTIDNFPLEHQIVVLPNDCRGEEGVEPCLRCPSWYQEVVAELEQQVAHFCKPKVVYPIKHKALEKSRIQS